MFFFSKSVKLLVKVKNSSSNGKTIDSEKNNSCYQIEIEHDGNFINTIKFKSILLDNFFNFIFRQRLQFDRNFFQQS